MIRNVDINDYKTCVDIENECFPKAEAASAKSIQSRIETFSNTFWVYEEDGTIISFINGMYSNEYDLKDEMYDGIQCYDQKGKWLMIFGVDTRISYQHKGYASTLMKYVISHLEDHCDGIVLTCKEKLLGFYQQFGFVNEGISNSTHGDVIWYQMRYTKK